MSPFKSKKKKFKWLLAPLLLITSYVYVGFSYQYSTLKLIENEMNEISEASPLSLPWYETTFATRSSLDQIKRVQNQMEKQLNAKVLQLRKEALSLLELVKTAEGNIDNNLYENQTKTIRTSNINELQTIIEEEHNRLYTALFSSTVTDYITSRKSAVSIGVYNADSKQTHVLNPDQIFETASIMKVSVMASLFNQDKVNTHTIDDLTIMITESDNDSVNRLWDKAGSEEGIADLWDKIGLTNTSHDPEGHWGLTRTTALDQVRLLKSITYPNNLFTKTQQKEMLALMKGVVSYQKWGVSAGVPSGLSVELKNGWLSSVKDSWRVHSIGHVKGEGRDYAIAILTDQNPTFEYGIETIETLSKMIYNRLP